MRISMWMRYLANNIIKDAFANPYLEPTVKTPTESAGGQGSPSLSLILINRNMKRDTITVIALLFAVSSPVYANPIIVTPGATPQEFISLFFETAVITILLSLWKFHPLRILYTWFFITVVTYWIFLYGTIGLLMGLDEISAISTPTGVTCALLIELIIIWLEALIIVKLSKRKFYRNSETPLSMKSALLVSLIGNVSSITLGLILFTA